MSSHVGPFGKEKGPAFASPEVAGFPDLLERRRDEPLPLGVLLQELCR